MPEQRAAAPVPDAPWYVKTPGPRPADITVPKEQTIERQGKTFVLWAGLLDTAHRAGLQSIHTHLVQCPGPSNGGVAIVHATAEFAWGTYDGIGDADDTNVGRNIVPHKIRMAETRAKARALRDALNVGMAAIEELGPEPGEQAPARSTTAPDGFRAAGAGTSRPAASTAPPAERKTYGTPMTRPPVSGSSSSDRWPAGQ